MRRTLAAIVVPLAVLVAAPSLSQGLVSQEHHQTSSPDDARYEITQSGVGVRWTFRLDRYSGMVDLMVSTTDDQLTWQPMPVLGLEPDPKANKPRFVIFISGHGARYTFLMDIRTGDTWILTRDIELPISDDETVSLDGWVPLPE